MSSKNGAVLSTEIVPEVLIIKENYEDWSIRLQTYLMAQGLWNIIVDEAVDHIDKAAPYWKRKNATALHAIHISCGPHAFSAIKHFPRAKQAWDELAILRYMPEPEPQISQPIQESKITAEDVLQHKNLHSAIWNGNQNAINSIIRANPDVVRAKITFSRRTALHMAAMAGKVDIVKMLVQNMSEEDMEITDKDGCTALAVAITSNATLGVAECMVQKNIKILAIKAYNMLPVAMAFRSGHKEMGQYLYSIMPKHYYLKTDPNDGKEIPSEDGATILCHAIYMQSFDVALDLLSKRRELATTLDSISGRPPLYAIANLPSAFLSVYRLRFWQRRLYHCICKDSSTCANIYTEHQNLPIRVNGSSMPESGSWTKFQGLTLYFGKILGIKDLYDKKLADAKTSVLLGQMCEMTKTLDENKMKEVYVIEALFLAVERGNVEFVKSILKANPELGLVMDETCCNIFMHAIKFRQPQIFSLIHNFNSKLSATSAIAYQKNNMLHIVAELAPTPLLNRNSGAALQMQSELQWFQEVKSIVPPWALHQKNVHDQTPDKLFTEGHKELVSKGEQWMKETATSCTVVGALIITIMFAAAFTVPGGNNDVSGFPIFLNKIWFTIFIISDAISLFSSTTSVLMFMGILTSRYAEQDFLHSLPKKLMFGLSTLFFSIASMMIAFSATLFIVLKDKYSWIFIPVICFACIPVTLFVFMQFPLLLDIWRSTYGGGIFDKKARISK